MENYNRKILFQLRKLAKDKGFRTSSCERIILVFEDYNILVIAGKGGRFTACKKTVFADLEVSFPANTLSVLILKLARFKIFDEYILDQLLK